MRSCTGCCRYRTGCLVAALILLVAPAASAQPDPSEDPRTNARVHAGPFYLTPALTLSELGVDTNVFNSADDPKADFTFTVTPLADVWVPLARRALLKVSSSVDLIYFHTFRNQRAVNPRVTTSGEIYFNRLTLFADGSYVNVRQRPSLEIDLRSRYTTQTLSVGLDLRAFRKVSLELQGRTSTLDFEDKARFEGTSLREALAHDTRAVSLALKYYWTPLTTIVLHGEAQQDRFSFARQRNADSIRLMPGVQFKPRALVSGAAHVGVRRFQALDDAVPDFQGAVASVSLSYALLGATVFSLTADRDIGYSFEPLEPYYVASGYGGSIQRHVGGRFDITVGARRDEYDYRDLAGVKVVTGPRRVDTTSNYSLSIGYRLGRDTRFGVGASYWERQSNLRDRRNYNGLRLLTGITQGR